jgi:Cys-tRNA(Pro)/Cys-tRNA(Cys) deacylase
MVVFVDVSVDGYETVFVSAGRRGLQVELAPADLVSLTSATRTELSA